MEYIFWYVLMRGGFWLILPIVIIVLLVLLRKRVINLEKKIKILERSVLTGDHVTANIESINKTSQSVETDAIDYPVKEFIQNEPNKFIKWIKEDWLLKLGAFLLLIGFGWLTSYAFMNNWIGPMGRITIGIVAGISILVLGNWRIKKYINQGGILIALGVAVVILTIFAAREIYDFFTPALALAMMFVAISFVGLTSVRYKSLPLALLALTLAYIMPLMNNFMLNDVIFLYSYLFVTSVGMLWVVAITGWKILPLISIISISLYSFFVISGGLQAEETIMLVFAYLFAALYFASGMASIIRRRELFATDILTAIINVSLLTVWITVIVDTVWQSLVLSFVAFIFAISAFLILQITKYKKPFYLYGAIALTLIGVATAMELSGAVLTLMLTLEIGVAIALSVALTRNTSIAKKMSWLYLIPVMLSAESMDPWRWGESIFNAHFFVILVLIMSFISLSVYYRSATNNSQGKSDVHFVNTLMLIGGFYTLALIWLSMGALFTDEVAVMSSLIIYTFIGITLYVKGLITGSNIIRLVGGLLVGGVVMRLLFIDIWAMDMSMRIIIFFIIGVLLISTALLSKRFNKHE